MKEKMRFVDFGIRECECVRGNEGSFFKKMLISMMEDGVTIVSMVMRKVLLKG